MTNRSVRVLSWTVVGASQEFRYVRNSLFRWIYWTSVQGLGNGFLFLVLVVAAVVTELINRNFGRAVRASTIMSAAAGVAAVVGREVF